MTPFETIFFLATFFCLLVLDRKNSNSHFVRTSVLDFALKCWFSMNESLSFQTLSFSLVIEFSSLCHRLGSATKFFLAPGRLFFLIFIFPYAKQCPRELKLSFLISFSRKSLINVWSPVSKRFIYFWCFNRHDQLSRGVFSFAQTIPSLGLRASDRSWPWLVDFDIYVNTQLFSFMFSTRKCCVDKVYDKNASHMSTILIIGPMRSSFQHRTVFFSFIPVFSAFDNGNEGYATGRKTNLERNIERVRKYCEKSVVIHFRWKIGKIQLDSTKHAEAITQRCNVIGIYRQNGHFFCLFSARGTF